MEAKLLTSSNKRQRVHQINHDRISQLPDATLYQIFSNMDMQQVVQTCVLSQKWRNLWRSAQYLNFHMVHWRFKKEKLPEFITNLLVWRDHSTVIKKFGVIGDEMINLDGFITLAATINVHELCLERMCRLDNATIGLAAEVRVKTLNLTGVDAYASYDINTLDFNSPIMETLVLHDFYHPRMINLRITAPRLRVLDMDGDEMGDNTGCLLTIDTPSLKSFRFKRCMYRGYVLQNLFNLEEADIEIDIESMEGERLGTRLDQFLTGISNTRSLKLSFKGYKGKSILKSATQIANMMQWPTVSFHNLAYLELMEWHNKEYMGAIAQVLGSFPCVETFILDKRKINFSPMMELTNRGPGLPFQAVFTHLKHVELRYSELSPDMFMLFEFLLRSAKVLETVIIKVRTAMSSQEQPELAHFNGYLKSAPKASSRVRLLVQFPGGVTLTCSTEN